MFDECHVDRHVIGFRSGEKDKKTPGSVADYNIHAKICFGTREM